MRAHTHLLLSAAATLLLCRVPHCLALAGGEADVRSCYTAMAVAAGLCLDAQALAAKAGMVGYIRRCQVSKGLV